VTKLSIEGHPGLKPENSIHIGAILEPQNGPQMDPTIIQNLLKTAQSSEEQFRSRLGSHVGTNWEPSLEYILKPAASPLLL